MTLTIYNAWGLLVAFYAIFAMAYTTTLIIGSIIRKFMDK
jgi:hypothetical protein